MLVKSVAKKISALAAGALMLGVASSAQASLIGDTNILFTLNLTSPIAGTEGTVIPLVEEGVAEIDEIVAGVFRLIVDVESESLHFSGENLLNDPIPNIAGSISITGLDWVGQDGFIIDLFPSSSLMGAATNFQVIDAGHGISFDFGVDLFPALTRHTLDIDLAVVHVPEPGTLAIMGLGLLGLSAARRKRMI